MIVALIGGAPAELGRQLASLLRDPWVATYGVSFGPPLVGASRALAERLAAARGAIDKLEAYCDTCLVPERERMRLYWKHRARVRSDDRREISRRSREAIDVTLRLHHPADAPAAIAAELGAVGAAVGPDKAALEARVILRLDDPLGGGLGARLGVPEEALVIEVELEAAARPLWDALGRRLGLEVRAIEEPQPSPDAENAG